MIECQTIARKWGNSLGVILPRELIEKEDIKENEKIKIIILKQEPLKKTFGIFKGKIKKTAQQLKDEMRADLHHG